ncbi:hypothetical protein ACFZDF_30800 [Streptomyces sp. NPDC007910]|uniref:hypothetical protein n=1 Tax=Streptomyces sp. NPDC007910 TaxID=3364790 RepID=UPI0036E7D296
MTAQYGPPICDLCSHPILSRVRTVPTFSTSGARPDATYHADKSECGTPPMGAPGVLGRVLGSR